MPVLEANLVTELTVKFFEQAERSVKDTLVGLGWSTGRAAAAMASNFVVGAEYSAILDGRQCEFCGALDGMEVEMPSELYTRFSPPQHNRCRCQWIPIKADDPQGFHPTDPKDVSRSVFAGADPGEIVTRFAHANESLEAAYQQDVRAARQRILDRKKERLAKRLEKQRDEGRREAAMTPEEKAARDRRREAARKGAETRRSGKVLPELDRDRAPGMPTPVPEEDTRARVDLAEGVSVPVRGYDEARGELEVLTDLMHRVPPEHLRGFGGYEITYEELFDESGNLATALYHPTFDNARLSRQSRRWYNDATGRAVSLRERTFFHETGHRWFVHVATEEQRTAIDRASVALGRVVFEGELPEPNLDEFAGRVYAAYATDRGALNARLTELATTMDEGNQPELARDARRLYNVMQEAFRRAP